MVEKEDGGRNSGEKLAEREPVTKKARVVSEQTPVVMTTENKEVMITKDDTSKKLSQGKEAAIEVEMCVAREKAMVPLETRMLQFRGLLEEKQVSAFSSWEKELSKIVFDPRYLLLTSKDRKAAFDKYVRERAAEERKAKAKEKEDPRQAVEMRQTDMCEEKSRGEWKCRENEKRIVVQPGWQAFKEKYKISIETYNVCYKAAVRKHKKENPSKETIPKRSIEKEIMEYMTAKVKARSEKLGRKTKLSKREVVGYEKISKKKVTVDAPAGPKSRKVPPGPFGSLAQAVEAPSPPADVVRHPHPPPCPQPRPQQTATAKLSVEKEPVLNKGKKPGEKVVLSQEAGEVVVVKFQCGICRKDFKYPKALQTHMSAHKYKSFQCPNCPKSFNSRKTLKQHMQKEVIECHCGDIFTSQVGLTKHQKSVHEMASCDKCPFEGTVQSVNIHKHNNHRPRPKKREGQLFPCQDCPKVYDDKTNLRRHVKVAHLKEEDLQEHLQAEDQAQVKVANGQPAQVRDGYLAQVADEHQGPVSAGPQAQEEGTPVPSQSEALPSAATFSTPFQAAYPPNLSMYPHFPYPVPNQPPFFYPPVQFGTLGPTLPGRAAAQVRQAENGDKCDYEKAGLPVD